MMGTADPLSPALLRLLRLLRLLGTRTPRKLAPIRPYSHDRSSGPGLFVQTATPDEDLYQPFRFADHQHVAGVDFDEGLHSAKRSDALVLNLCRDGTITPSEYPRAWHIVGHTTAVNFFYHDGG